MDGFIRQHGITVTKKVAMTEEYLKYDVLFFKKLVPAREIQDKHPKRYRLLLSRDYPNSGSKSFLLTTWDWWFNNIASVPYKPNNAQHFYEILKDYEPCKLFMDIDGKSEFDVYRFLNVHVPEMCKRLSDVLKKEVTKPAIIQACTKNKKSFHLIFNDVVCDGTLSCGELVKECLSDLPAVDLAVYSSRRSFRLCNSSKGDRNTAFVLLDKDTKIEDTYATLRNPYEKEVDYDKKPMAKNLVKVFHRSKRMKYDKVGESREADIKFYVSKIRERYPTMELVGDPHLKDGRIFLKAKNIVCSNIGRCHQSNNMFITVVEKSDETLNVGNNLPSVSIRCSDKACELSSIIDRFYIY